MLVKTERPTIVVSLVNRVHFLCFGAGFALSSATQLRFINGALGLSELFFICAIILSAVRFVKSGARVNSNFVPILFFIGGSTILLTLGFFSAMVASYEVLGASHDVVAFLFVASIICALFQLNAVEIKKTLSVSIYVGIVSLTALYILAQTYGGILGFDFWLGQRFKGWANNPNQLGLYFSSMPFLLLYLLSQESSTARRFCYFAMLFGSFCLGYSTHSDALYVAWGAGFSVLLFFLFVKRWSSIESSSRGLVLKLVIALGFLFLLGGVVLLIAKGMNAAVITMLEAENNQGSVRFAIWVNSLSVIFEAPYVGWGPGAHAGIEFPHDNFESHNTLLDWGSGTGLMGVLSLLVVYFWVVVVTIKFRSGTLLATVVALITVSMFHNYLRHPVFWFYLLLPLLLANFLSFYADLRSKASCVE